MEKNSRDEYFNKLNECSIKVHNFIEQKINELPANFFNEVVQKILEKRKLKNTFRPFLTKCAFDVLSNKNHDSENYIPLYALSEINNISLYLDNWILDNKNDIWNNSNQKEIIGKTIIASAIIREIGEKIIFDLDILPSQKKDVLKSLSEATIQSYVGQNIDMGMSVENIETYTSDKQYLEKYIEKSLLQSGYLYGISTKIGAILADSNQETVNLVEKLGQIIGTGLHISNDLGDFAIINSEGGFKDYQDQMSDIRNGRLTLPIYWVLKNGTKDEQQIFKEAFNKKDLTDEQKLLIIKAIHNSGAFTYCKKIIRQYYTDAKKIIKMLPDNENRIILSTALSIIRNNKYISNLKNSRL